MKAVGIRDLKNRLSKYIRLVKRGEDILVTDRGQVVAELRAASQSPLASEYPGLNELLRQGRVRLGAPNHPGLYPRRKTVLKHSRVMRLLNEERGER